MQIISIYIISLDKDNDRLSRLMTALSNASVEVPKIIKISAIYGGSLPETACLALTHAPSWVSKRGEIGCFLSHVKTWEAVRHQSGPCLILEDDAVPNGFERLETLSLPDGAELIFVNNRTSIDVGGPDAPIAFVPITEAIKTLNKSGKGVGGDGYILTPKGAQKLLDAVKADLFFGHVDWRMLRYCIVPADLEGELAGTRCDNIIRNHHNQALPPKWGVVTGFCLSNALVTHSLRHQSSRLAENVT